MSDLPAVELDVLNAILENAVAALPHALHVGKAVVEMMLTSSTESESDYRNH